MDESLATQPNLWDHRSNHSELIGTTRLQSFGVASWFAFAVQFYMLVQFICCAVLHAGTDVELDLLILSVLLEIVHRLL
jgi:hypothetical protein